MNRLNLANSLAITCDLNDSSNKKSRRYKHLNINRLEYEPHHPHDSFFQKSMENVKVARDFIKAYLPEEILSAIDLSCLELQPRVHYKNIGHKIVSDIVYKTKINNDEAYLYFSIEHQSTNDKMMALIPKPDDI